MICVYPADCTDFSTNGNGTVEPTSALVTETLNGEYELTLVHASSAAGCVTTDTKLGKWAFWGLAERCRQNRCRNDNPAQTD